jgi:hypothetical protein
MPQLTMVERPETTVVMATAAATDKVKVDHPLMALQWNFPNKVYKMLEYAHAHDLSEVCGWNDSGMSFAITDATRFMQELASRFFPNQSSFRSCKWQVNASLVAPFLWTQSSSPFPSKSSDSSIITLF